MALVSVADAITAGLESPVSAGTGWAGAGIATGGWAGGLFSIAESYAVSRLTPDLRRSRRVEITIELSRTLAKHAEYASEQQQQDLWKRAQSIVADATALWGLSYEQI